jgi:hypothetical protein
MNEFHQYLDQESLDGLLDLLGSEIQMLLSPDGEIWVNLGDGHNDLHVSSVSIPIGRDRFVVVRADWIDTPVDAIDYCILSVRIASTPLGIWYNSGIEPDGVNYNYKADHLSLHLGAVGQVAKIYVLSNSGAGPEELVHCDIGLIIVRADGVRFALVWKFFGHCLCIAYTQPDIERLTAEYSVRLVYGA